MMSTTLEIPRDGFVVAASVALGNGWLVGLGILAADRVFCVFMSSGLADELQPSSLRLTGNKRPVQSLDSSCTRRHDTDPDGCR